MNKEVGTVLYVCQSCGKSNTIKYGEKLECKDCIYSKEKLIRDWDNPRKINNSNNWVLNKIGNLFGHASHILLKPYLKWGTFFTIDLREDIDEEDL